MAAAKKKHDRYKRLRDIREFGYDVDWSILRKKTVLVAGVGGLGTIFAEIMARVGIGKLILIDFDVVEEVNLNRLFFRPEHLGRNKASCAAEVLREINPDVEVEAYDADIMLMKNFEDLVRKSDLVASGLDNYPARLFLNKVCIDTNTPYVDAGASRSGLSGYVHLVIPRKTACYQCIGSLELEKKELADEECTASLPTTMAIIASLQAQYAIKYLLNFGTIPGYITYDAITDTFRVIKVKRDPQCPICGKKAKKISKEEAIRMIDELIKKQQERFKQSTSRSMGNTSARPRHS